MEDPPQDGEPFDYDAVPSKFYFEVEGVGSLEPDQIIQEGIKIIQEKMALLLHMLTGEAEDDGMGDFDGPRSPNLDMDGGNPWGQDPGYTTPYNNGAQSSWGGNATTPYTTTTPYGGSGQSGWN